MITRMDRDIGRLLDLLQQLGIDENTVIFFSSDNGPHREGGADPNFFNSSGGLRGIKRSLHEGGIRVPLLVRWKGRIKAGTTSDHVTAFWDFLPTAAELAGAKAPANTDGISIVPTLLRNNKSQRKHQFLYWEFHEGKFAQGVRMGDWKAVRYNLKDIELYNLKKDRQEKNNVAAEHPEIVRRIEEYLRTARTESEEWPIRLGGKQKKKKKG
jgi:arylsulfatase A-like enzyme